MNEPLAGYSVWVSSTGCDWYPVHKFLTLAEAQREATRLRMQGSFVEVRINTSLVW